jgi:hypothetical protein
MNRPKYKLMYQEMKIMWNMAKKDAQHWWTIAIVELVVIITIAVLWMLL